MLPKICMVADLYPYRHSDVVFVPFVCCEGGIIVRCIPGCHLIFILALKDLINYFSMTFGPSIPLRGKTMDSIRVLI